MIYLYEQIFESDFPLNKRHLKIWANQKKVEYLFFRELHIQEKLKI